MNDNCITRFEVSNFKKFDHLVVENLGQVNLITGDNNVGKTSLLEALLCNEDNLRWIKHLHNTLCFRRIHIHPKEIHSKEPKFPNENFLSYILKDIKKPLICNSLYTNLRRSKLELSHKSINDITDLEKSKRLDKYDINVKDWILFYKNNILDELQWLYYDDIATYSDYSHYWPFIAFNVSYGEDLHDYIVSFTQKTTELNYNEKQEIIKYLKYWIHDIIDYEFKPFGRNQLIGIATENNKNYTALTQFGDGIQKIFRYILEIMYAKKQHENRIMIDEIDTGVHYLKMKDQWKAIFQLSNETGIQIFATTHSMDCIKAFVDAGEEVSDIKNDIRLIELEEFTDMSGNLTHTAKTYNHELLKYNLETETNIRGGDVWQ